MFGKIFESMFSGSMVGSGALTFALMSYIIAHMRPDTQEGMVVELNPRLVSAILGESEESVAKKIEDFCGPDAYSRSPEEQGRKLVKLGQFAYRVVNGLKYRQMQNEEQRRELTRKRVRKYRQNKDLDACNAGVTQRNAGNAKQKQSSEAESEAEVQKQGADAPLQLPEKLRTARMCNKWEVWQTVRRGMRSKPKNWLAMFQAQVEFLSQFTEPDAFEVLSSSIRNNYQGLFPPQHANTTKTSSNDPSQNPRNYGVCRAGPDFGEAAKRKLLRQADAERNGTLEGGVVKGPSQSYQIPPGSA